VLSTNLTESGYDVETAEDGYQALELLHTQPLDVVLLDLDLPRIDGYQALEQVKASGGLRRIPVIVISSMDDMASNVARPDSANPVTASSWQLTARTVLAKPLGSEADSHAWLCCGERPYH
jgi:CheY-like chemotaxis protein